MCNAKYLWVEMLVETLGNAWVCVLDLEYAGVGGVCGVYAGGGCGGNVLVGM